MSFAGGLAAKPRFEQHPLLSAMLEGDADGARHEQEMEVEQAMLAHRLEELRWSEPRRGTWATPPEPRRPIGDGSSLHIAARHALEARGSPKKSPGKAGRGGMPAASEDWQQLLRAMDPDNAAVVSPDALVPLMFWLGLTRRRGAALIILQLAFGPGDISTAALRELSAYAEVQVRLVEGMRKLARRESLEQLCEFLTDCDLLQMRTWFYSMKRSPDGHANIVEVQNLFAREGVTSDRQNVFRFLSHVARTDCLPALVADSGEGKAGGTNRFDIEEFVSIVSRCIVAWCLQRTIGLLASPAALLPAAGGAPEGVPLAVRRESSTDGHDMALRWTQLQRKITVSLLINHRYWGRESRNVLGSLKPPATTTIGEELSPEQWQCLYQRVRAQGMAAILPVGDEADDPGFLKGKTRPSTVGGAGQR